MDKTILNLEVYDLHNIFSLINTKHNPFSKDINYDDIKLIAIQIISSLKSKGIKYISIDYDNGVELIELVKFVHNLNADHVRDISQSIIEYDMTPNQSVKLGKFIKINFREVHNFLKEMRI